MNSADFGAVFGGWKGNSRGGFGVCLRGCTPFWSGGSAGCYLYSKENPKNKTKKTNRKEVRESE